MPRLPLERLAVLHSGDKGDTCNLGVVPLTPQLSSWLAAHLTIERVREHFGPLVTGPVRRYELPGSGCLNFVLENALAGGVTRSLGIDGHGKSWSYYAASLELDVPDHVLDGIDLQDLDGIDLQDQDPEG